MMAPFLFGVVGKWYNGREIREKVAARDIDVWGRHAESVFNQ